MTIKATGKEFNDFYNDPAFWRKHGENVEGTWHEDEELFINGELVWDYDYTQIQETDSVEIRGGCVFNPVGVKEVSFEGYFKRWRRLQTTELFVVTTPKDKSDAIKAAVRAAGGVVG